MMGAVLIFDGVLFFGCHWHSARGVLVAASGGHPSSLSKSASTRSHSASHRHPAHSACGQGEGDGIVGREVAFTRSLEPRNC
jgi:hypothetical protein